MGAKNFFPLSRSTPHAVKYVRHDRLNVRRQANLFLHRRDQTSD